MTWAQDLLYVVLAVSVALLPIVLLLRLRGAPDSRRMLHRRLEPIVLLFRDRELIDATAPGRELAERRGFGDLDGMMHWLGLHLPDCATALAVAQREGRGVARGHLPGSAAALSAVFEDLGGGTLRLTLSDPTVESAGTIVDALSLAALENEAETLRDAVDAAPILAWRQRRDGTITWANAAYIDCCEALGSENGLWPLPQLIAIDLTQVQAHGDVHGDDDTSPPAQRHRMENDGNVMWFDCHLRATTDDEMLVYALPADTAVQAERNLREFVQTLTKTFADLPIGLAIFDRDRNLQLFNPALMDLTRLPVGFLSARPSLFALLDRLREARMIPEPRDYRSWRKQMAMLEAGAASGHHVETWSLPGGQTYRVTGRPHAEGGVALLLEDITSEITQTRGYRADLSLHAQILEGLEDAVAVVGGAGDIVLSNRAWDELCGSRQSLADVVTQWSADSTGVGVARLLEAISARDTRSAVSGAAVGPGGAPVGWRVSPLPGERSLVTLRALPATQLSGRMTPANRDRNGTAPARGKRRGATVS